jgi:hypothetical protein
MAIGLSFDMRQVPRNHARLCALIEAVRLAPADTHETDSLEWKTNWDLRAPERRFETAKHLLGFGNRSVESARRDFQGCAYFMAGVAPWTLVGVEQHDPATLEDWLGQYIAPGRPRWTPYYVSVNDSRVLVVLVEAPRPGDPICTLQKGYDKARAGRVYVRRNGKTEEASPDDVRALEHRLLQPRLSDAARQDAEMVAEDAFSYGTRLRRTRRPHLNGALGLAATGRAENVKQRIFDPVYHRLIDRYVDSTNVLRRDGHYVESLTEDVTASSYTVASKVTHFAEPDAYIAIRSDGRGAVGVYFSETVVGATIDEVLAWWVTGAWQMALLLQAPLGSFDGYRTMLHLDARGLKDVQRAEPIFVEYGPVPMPDVVAESERDWLKFLGPASMHIPAVRREVLRDAGKVVYENVLRPDAASSSDVRAGEEAWSPLEVRNQLGLWIGRNRGRSA